MITLRKKIRVIFNYYVRKSLARTRRSWSSCWLRARARLTASMLAVNLLWSSTSCGSICEYCARQRHSQQLGWLQLAHDDSTTFSVHQLPGPEFSEILLRTGNQTVQHCFGLHSLDLLSIQISLSELLLITLRRPVNFFYILTVAKYMQVPLYSYSIIYNPHKRRHSR